MTQSGEVSQCLLVSGTATCNLANAQYVTGPAMETQDDIFCCSAGLSAPTRLAIVHWAGCINAKNSNSK